MELVALKVKIGYKPDRTMKYPDFNSLPPGVRGGQDWTIFVDRYGGWHYDKLSRLGESDEVNPDPESQFGMFLVPESFARAALAAFPDTVEALSETEAAEFYDNRAHVAEPSQRIDPERLNTLRAKYGIPAGILDAGPDWDEADVLALDPDHPAPGITKNPNRYYADFKAKRGFVIKGKIVAEPKIVEE